MKFWQIELILEGKADLVVYGIEYELLSKHNHPQGSYDISDEEYMLFSDIDGETWSYLTYRQLLDNEHICQIKEQYKEMFENNECTEEKPDPFIDPDFDYHKADEVKAIHPSISQEDMSKITGVPLPMIKNWEKGYSAPYDETIIILKEIVKEYLDFTEDSTISDHDLRIEAFRTVKKADEVYNRYIDFFDQNDIDPSDESNTYVKNAQKVIDIQKDGISKCTSFKELQNLIDDLKELEVQANVSYMEPKSKKIEEGANTKKHKISGFFNRYIYLSGKGIDENYLGVGIDAVLKLYRLAENGSITNAESVEVDYCANCELVFKGKELMNFLQEHFPEYLENNTVDIDPDDIYRVAGIDFT